MTHSHPLSTLEGLSLGTAQAEVVQWQGKTALLLNGLVWLPDWTAASARMEVSFAAEGPCYPGLVFHMGDPTTYELVYVQPHTSGKWDAMQYDPVFNDSNTWQLYHGEGYQKAAQVPTGQWMKMVLEFNEQSARVTVDGQEPLFVPHLAGAGFSGGPVGLWTYLPAYFCDLSISELSEPLPEPPPLPALPPDMIREWSAWGYPLECEPQGFLNLNRHFSPGLKTVVLTRQFETTAPDVVHLKFGFSDSLNLQLDGRSVYRGRTRWKPLPAWRSRGYVHHDYSHVDLPVEAGVHTLTARVSVSEYFGWGIIMSFNAACSHLLPLS